MARFPINYTPGESEPDLTVEGRLAALEEEGEDHESRLTTAEDGVADHETRLTTAEGGVDDHETRVGAVETTLTTTTGRLGIVETSLDFLVESVSKLPVQPVATGSGQFTATINDNSLQVLLTGVINFDADRYVVTTNDTVAPTGAVGSLSDWSANAVKAFTITLSGWTQNVIRLWARRTSDATWIMLDPSPANTETPAGLLVTPVAIGAPSKPSFVTDQVGVDPATEFNYAIGAVTTPDNQLLTVELWGAVAGLLETLAYDWDGTTPITGTYSELAPDTSYWPFVKVYVTSEPGRLVNSDQDPITTAAVGAISSVTITPYVGSFSTDTITAITKADPGVITTSAAHGLSAGDLVRLTGIVGMVELNNLEFYVNTTPTTDTLTLKDVNEIPVDTTDLTAYVSGGTITKAVTTPITDITLDATATAYGVDEILFQVGVEHSWEVNDFRWEAISGASALSLAAYGDITVFARGRNSSYPTSMTPTYSLSVSSTAGSGNAVISFVQSEKVTTEIGAPTVNVRVTKANDATAAVTFTVVTSDGVGLPGYGAGGVSDVNYKAVNKQYSIPNGTTYVDIPVTILEDGLGERDVDFYLSINEASITNAELGNIGVCRFVVQGSHGWLPYVSSDTGLPELDVNNPPTVMSTISSQIFTGSKTISGKRIDAAMANNAVNGVGQVNFADGGDNRALLLENCDIINAGGSLVKAVNYGYIKIRNCRLYNGGRNVNGAPAFAPGCGDNNDSRYRKIETLNNRFELTQGGEIGYICYSKDTSSERHFSYNYMNGFIQLDPVVQGSNPVYANTMYRPGNWHTYYHISVEGNVFYQHRRDGDTAPGYPWPFGKREDVFNFWNSGGQNTGPGVQIHANVIVGCGLYGTTGAFGIQTADYDVTLPRNFTITCNTISNISNGGMGVCPNSSSAYANMIYQAYPNTNYYEDYAAGYNQSSVGLMGSGNPTSPYLKAYCGLNDGTWWTTDGSTIYRNFKWIMGTPVVAPSGWDTNQIITALDDTTGTTGHNRFRKMRFPIMYQDKGDGTFGDPSFDDDIEWLYFSHDFPLGDAKVNYIAATKQLNLAPHGGAAGAYIDFDVPQRQDTANSKSSPLWYVYTSLGESGPWGLVRLRNGGASLLSTDTVYTVKVTRFTPLDRSMYVGPTGYRTGAVAGVAPTGDDVTPPETPPTIASTVVVNTTSFYATSTLAEDTESNIAAYIWRVDEDNATVQETAGQTSPTFTVTAGQHSVQVAARDTAGNTTSWSQGSSVDTTTSAYDIANTEFNADTDWSTHDSVLTAAGGIGNMQNSGTGSGMIYQAFTKSGETTLTYSWKIQGPCSNAIIGICTQSPVGLYPMYPTSNPPWVYVHWIGNLGTGEVWDIQEKIQTGWGSKADGTYYIVMYTNAAGGTANNNIDYIRLVQS